MPERRGGEDAPRLRALLGSLGVPSDTQMKVLAVSEPDLQENGDIYQRVNDCLVERVATRPIRIEHLTGEAVALGDPAHRRVIKLCHERGLTARLGCFFEDGGATADAFFRHSLRCWRHAEWFDFLDALFYAASARIAIYRLRRAAPVHYSLFANDLVLLQDKHRHNEPKRVWFIESPGAVAALEPRLEEAFVDAERIPAQTFANLLDWLYRSETIATLVGPEGGESVAVSVDEMTVDRLVDFGLIQRLEGGIYEPTSHGRELIDNAF
jgi:hypothetical protein